MDKLAKGLPKINMAQPSGMGLWSPMRHREATYHSSVKKNTSETQDDDEDDDERPKRDASMSVRARFLENENVQVDEGEKARTESDENESKDEIQKPRISSHQAWSKQAHSRDDSKRKQAYCQSHEQQHHERNTTKAAIKLKRQEQKGQVETMHEHEIEEADEELRVHARRQSWRVPKPQQQ